MWQNLLLLSLVVYLSLPLPLDAQPSNSESNSTFLGFIVSRNKPATQSSPYGWTNQGTVIPISAGNANDGNYDTIWGKTPGKYCSHTRLDINPWWQVDLQDQFNITQVKIWNRQDCCADRLLPLKIEVSTNGSSPWVQCAHVDGTGEAGKVYTIPCVARGRFVRITDEKITKLTLCEVDVYGIAANEKGAGQQCVFPFYYQGKLYQNCTTNGLTTGRYWCSLTDNYHRDEKWRHCDTSAGACTFPYIFNRKSYTTCTTDGRTDGKLWCSLTENYTRDEAWRFC
jgi:hypothetical protein